MFNGKANNYNRKSAEITLGTAKTAIGEASYDIQGFQLKTIHVYNNSAYPFTSGVIEVSSDNVHFATLIGIYGGTLAAGVMWATVTKDAWKYIKFSGAAAAGSYAKAQFWITM